MRTNIQQNPTGEVEAVPNDREKSEPLGWGFQVEQTLEEKDNIIQMGVYNIQQRPGNMEIYQWLVVRNWSQILDSTEPGTLGSAAQECLYWHSVKFSLLWKAQSSKEGERNDGKHSDYFLSLEVLKRLEIFWLEGVVWIMSLSTQSCTANKGRGHILPLTFLGRWKAFSSWE